MPIAIVGDVHIGNQVRSRKDDYFETCILKLREILSKNQTVLFLGDLFNTPSLDLYKMQRVISLLKEFPKVKIYTICGNHDVYNMNLTTLNKTALGLLSYFGVNVLTDKNCGTIIDKQQLFDILPLTYEEISSFESSGSSKILVGHHFFDLPCSDSISREMIISKFGQYKYIFLGHDHKEYDPVYLPETGTTIYRPGSLLRNAATDYNFHRTPSYLVLHDDGSITREILECARSAEEVFLPEVINQEAKQKKYFIDKIDNLIEKYSKQLASTNKSTYSVKDTFLSFKPRKECYEYLKSVYNVLNADLT